MRIMWVLCLLVGCTSDHADSDVADSDSGAETRDTDPPLPTLDQSIAEALADQEVPVQALEPLPTQDPPAVALGEALFYDPILSGNKDIACATCHDPAHGTGDGLVLSLGTGATGRGPERGEGEHPGWLPRHSPSLWGRARLDAQFWDGRVERTDDGVTTQVPLPERHEQLDVLGMQALHPILDVAEMRGRPGDLAVDGTVNELALADPSELWPALEARLRSHEAYRELFAAAFPSEPWGMSEAAMALAAFQRERFDATDTPWDRYLAGELDALGDDAKLGALFFLSGRCSVCHAGPALTDQGFHNIGLPFVGSTDVGREEVSGEAGDRYAFRTPPLRNVADSPPYMHNGVLADINAVLTHYADPASTSTEPAPEHLPEDLLLVGTEDELRTLRETLSPSLPTPETGASTVGLSNLRAFLEALTDEEAVERARRPPESVPSGLTVGGG